jgi:hypothetical protein
MKNEMKTRMTVLSIIVCMFTLSCTVGATTLPANQSNGATTMKLDIASAQLSVEVPLTLSFAIDKNGAVTSPTAIVITNKSYAPVKVVTATVNQTSPWSIVAMTTDFITKKVNTKDFAFSLAGQSATQATSFVTSGFAQMAATDTAITDANKLSLTLGSVTRIAPQRSLAASQEVAQLVFVFDFVD